jgi:ubiquinone/menaquinone biosynthesis C-methylase UbiE
VTTEPPADAARSFDRSARVYDDHVSPNREGARRLVLSLPEGRYPRLVDVACGTGFATLHAIPRLGVREVAAVDASAPMLEVLRERLEAEHPGVRAHLHARDVLDLPVPDGWADAALCTMALHWFTRRAEAIREMARTLAPGGVLGVLAPGPGHDAETVALIGGTGDAHMTRLSASILSNQIDPDDLAGYMRDAGLEVLDVWTETRRRSRTPDAYAARCEAVASHLWDDLSEGERADVAARLRRLFTGAAGPDGLYRYAFVKTYAVARRPG